MATAIILTKHGRTLVAEHNLSIDAMQGIKEGAKVRAVITVPRNIKHHNLLFALLNTVFKAQTAYPTLNALLDALKLATGHVRQVQDFHGNIHFVPASIDFATLDQVAFAQWFDQAVRVILEHVLPNTNRKGLEDEIYHMLGEPAPSDMRG